jgi:hypothetical protein
MKRGIGLVLVMAAVGLSTGADLLACGEKFLAAGRGTRYHRPKGFRAASILMYASTSTGLDVALRKLPVESVLKRQGHRFTTVTTPEQLSAILATGRFDVVLTAASDASTAEQLLGGRPDAPILLSFCVKGGEKPVAEGPACALKAPPKERHLLEAIDKAVEQHDRNARKAETRL